MRTSKPPEKSPLRRLVDAETGLVLCDNAELARGIVQRLFGVIGRGLPAGAALGLFPCDWVHTFFAPYPLDLAFCDADGRILYIIAGVPPYRLPPRVRGAKIVWETRAGTLAPHITVGGRLIMD